MEKRASRKTSEMLRSEVEAKKKEITKQQQRSISKRINRGRRTKTFDNFRGAEAGGK